MVSTQSYTEAMVCIGSMEAFGVGEVGGLLGPPTRFTRFSWWFDPRTSEDSNNKRYNGGPGGGAPQGVFMFRGILGYSTLMIQQSNLILIKSKLNLYRQ